VLTAHRVGGSPVTVPAPLMPYFGMIVVFAQRYQKDAGVGAVVAMSLPYVVILYLVWTALLVFWYLLTLPLGV